MNVILNYLKFACVALALGITSCSKEQLAEQSGEMTTLSLNLSYAQGNTRATDQNATAAETKVSSIDVFIFDANTNGLVNHKRLSDADFEAKTNSDGYKSKDGVKIETSVGDKKIVIVANLPSTFPNVTSIGTLKQAWGITLSTLTDATNGFMMISDEPVAATLVAKGDATFATKNTISTTIERVVAKVGVKKDDKLVLDLKTGTFSAPQFAIRQSNKKLFPLQLEESGVIKDPNWDTYVESDFENIPVYEPLNTGTTYTDWKVKYAAENTSENPNRENSTYASIQVQFVPTFFCDAKGDPTIASNNLSTDFWVVKDKDGNIYYFDDNSNAIAFSTSIGSTVSAKYTGGVCYYSAYLNPDNGYNTIRNSFYILNIKSLVPPGRPTAEPDPSDPLSEPTDMKFDANIAPWGIFEKDYELL